MNQQINIKSLVDLAISELEEYSDLNINSYFIGPKSKIDSIDIVRVISTLEDKIEERGVEGYSLFERIFENDSLTFSELVWATTMAWAIEKKLSNKARLLAIFDNEGYSKKLVRYFKLIGFKIVKEVGSSPIDLLLRLVWGGAGTLMNGECISILKKLEKKLSLIEKS